MAKKGGKRAGAGRPKGSTNVPRFSDYVTDKERKTFAEFVIESYMGDVSLAKWFGDNAFSAPLKSIDLTTGGETLPTPLLHVLDHNSSKENRGTK